MIKKRCIFLLLPLFLTTCGLEELYFLPQPTDVQKIANTGASIILPSISSYYYSKCYTIFYKIYTSSESINTSITDSTERGRIHPTLNNDFNSFETMASSINAMAPTADTFKNSGFYELDFEGETGENLLSKNGRTIFLDFRTSPGSIPLVEVDNSAEYNLLRSQDLISPEPGYYFQNSPDLLDSEKANREFNGDVAARAGDRYTYVLMYIVAEGYDNARFSRIFSKPAFVNIFGLPEAN